MTTYRPLSLCLTVLRAMGRRVESVAVYRWTINDTRVLATLSYAPYAPS